MTPRTKKRIFIIWMVIGIPLSVILLLRAQGEHHVAQKLMADPIFAMAAQGRQPNDPPSVITNYYDTLVLKRNLYTFAGVAVLAAPIAFLLLGRIQSSRNKVQASPSHVVHETASEPGAAKTRKRRTLVVSALIVLVLTLLVLSDFYTDYQLKRAAQEEVARALADPESARFRDVHVVRAAVCGQVNAKNRLGGYTGFSDFVYLEGSAAIAVDNDDTFDKRELNKRIKQICRP